MAVKWERFAGSTDSFAVRLSFMSDPDEGAGIDPDEAASWGSLQIWVNGQNLCAHVDQGETLSSVHWYLLPLLEWITESWDPLLHEERLPYRNAFGPAAEVVARSKNAPALAEEAGILAWEEEWFNWRRRHALRAAREGGIFPNIVFRRVLDDIEISWRDERLAGTTEDVRFSASNGAVQMLPGDVANTLYELVDAAASYLRTLNPSSARYARLHRKVLSRRDPNAYQSRLQWLAGATVYDPMQRRIRNSPLEDDLANKWTEIVEALTDVGSAEAANAALAGEHTDLAVTGSSQAVLLFGSSSPTIGADDITTLAAVLADAYSPNFSSPRLEQLVRRVRFDPVSMPWEQGYELAEELHEELELTNDWVDIERIFAELAINVSEHAISDVRIRACSIVGPQHRPSTVINKSSRYAESGFARRFTLAHELCHILYDRQYGNRLAIASGPWAPRGIEQRANAFAAMFLMPTRIVRDAVADLPDPINDFAALRVFADRLRVSNEAAIEHLYNLTLLSDEDRTELRRQAGV